MRYPIVSGNEMNALLKKWSVDINVNAVTYNAWVSWTRVSFRFLDGIFGVSDCWMVTFGLTFCMQSGFWQTDFCLSVTFECYCRGGCGFGQLIHRLCPPALPRVQRFQFDFAHRKIARNYFSFRPSKLYTSSKLRVDLRLMKLCTGKDWHVNNCLFNVPCIKFFCPTRRTLIRVLLIYWTFAR